jgi:hypothetical protein
MSYYVLYRIEVDESMIERICLSTGSDKDMPDLSDTNAPVVLVAGVFVQFFVSDS